MTPVTPSAKTAWGAPVIDVEPDPAGPHVAALNPPVTSTFVASVTPPVSA